MKKVLLTFEEDIFFTEVRILLKYADKNIKVLRTKYFEPFELYK